MSTRATLVVNPANANPMANLSCARLRISIDAEVYKRKWGMNEFDLDPGDHQIKVYYWHFIYGDRCEKSIDVRLMAGETCHLKYTMPLTSMDPVTLDRVESQIE